MMFKNRSRTGSIAATLAIFGLLLAAPAGALELQDISYSALPGNRVEIILTTDEPVSSPATFATDNPARIAIDLPGAASSLKRKTMPIGVGVARSVAAIEAGDRTRVVINLLESVPHEISQAGNRLVVSIDPGNKSARTAAPVSAAPVSAVSVAEQDSAPAPRDAGDIRAVDFRRGPDGEGRIEITLGDPSMIVDMQQRGQDVVLDFMDAALPDALARTLDVVDFATPVVEIETRPDGTNVHMRIRTKGEFEFLAYQANELYTVEFRELTAQEKELQRRQQLVYTGERLSLNFQDIEVRSVLQLLADFTGLNMVVSDTVAGRITLRLKNVPWDQAMDIILKTKGLSQRRTENVILVAPTEEIAAREKLELESQKQIEELAPLRSELIQVNYAKAADLAVILKTAENKLLSERGSVTIDARTNTLLVQDTAAKLEELRALLEKLDVPVRQVLIESRIVIANADFARDIGSKVGLGTQHTEGSHNFVVGGGLPGGLSNVNNIGAPGIIEGGADGTSDGAQSLLVNLPQTLAAGSGGAINLLVGKVGSYLLNLELTAMQREGKGEVISSPRVITSDQSKATIKQGLEIPYQEFSDGGNTAVAFKEAVLKLDVTPQITPDDRVVMKLEVNKDTANFSNQVAGVPAVDTRELNTTVLVDNGETVVLGGIYEQTIANQTQRVPFFGELPGVGFLFRQKLVQDTKSELLIFVTPKILKETLTLR